MNRILSGLRDFLYDFVSSVFETRVSVVIPAFNEEKTVRRVAIAASHARLAHEVIVVDNASSDNSVEKVKGIGVRVERLEESKGKSAVIEAGVKAAHGEVVCVVDADWTNVSAEKIDALIKPVLEGHADFTKAVFSQVGKKPVKRLVKPFARVIRLEFSFHQPVRVEFCSKKEVLEGLSIKLQGIDNALLLDAVRQGFKVLEVDVGEFQENPKSIEEIAKTAEVGSARIAGKKILIIAWFYYPILGGAETIIKTIAEHFAKSNLVSVLTSCEKGEESEVINGVQVFRTELLHSYPLKGDRERAKRLKPFFEEFLRTQNPDVVHASNLSYVRSPKCSFIMLECCNSLGIPIIEHSHNAQLKTPGKTRKIILGRWSKIVCVSDFVVRRLKSLGVRPERLVRIYNGIDCKVFSPERFSEKDRLAFRREVDVREEQKIVLFPSRVFSTSSGKLEKQKQFSVVFKACEILAKKGVDFKLVASGAKEFPAKLPEMLEKSLKEFNELLQKKKLSEEIILLEKIYSPLEMPLLFYCSDIIVTPSFKETFGLVFVEGMALEKPVIAARSGGPVEIIDSGKNGFLIKLGDFKALARILEKLLKDASLREQIGKNARKKVLEKFSSQKMLAGFERVYSQVLKEPKTK